MITKKSGATAEVKCNKIKLNLVAAACKEVQLKFYFNTSSTGKWTVESGNVQKFMELDYPSNTDWV